MADGTLAEAGFFEGTEKRVEIDFTGAGDLRQLPASTWETVAKTSGTLILHRKDTPSFTSFLLSESSLIVYKRKVILKTCGRTTPLTSVPQLFGLLREAEIGLEPEWMSFSRKNFQAPHEQPMEHQSTEAEIALCRQACSGVGDAYVLGPLTSEHWLVYDSMFKDADCSVRGDFQVDLMMHALPKGITQHFFTSAPEGDAEAAALMTRSSGLLAVAEAIGGEVDDYCFSPCGYSCNIHIGEAYAMVHVTPQEGCSYANFETNFGSTRDGRPTGPICERVNALIGRVLDVFRPEKLTMTLFMDQGAAGAVKGAPFDVAMERYRRTSCSSVYFENDYSATIQNFVACPPNLVTSRKRSREACDVAGSGALLRGA